MFNAYESKPVTRMAVQISELETLFQIIDKESTWEYKGVSFKAYQNPVIGDYVVKLTEEDTYHVSRDVFRERNIVSDEDI